MGFNDDSDSSNDSKYAGFRTHWDKDLRAYVFDSKDERDRWQRQQYGRERDGFLAPDEGRGLDLTERPRLRPDKKPLFATEEERLRYERAVHFAPPEKHGSMDAFDYLREIGKIATGFKPDELKSMPDVPKEDEPW